MDEKTIGVIVATPWEAQPLVRALNLRIVEPNQYEGKIQSGTIVLAVCGIGQHSAKHMALELAHRNPSLLISCGYGGALQPGIRSGDLAMDIQRSDAAWGAYIKDLAQNLNLKLHEGIFYSAEKIFATPEEKRRAGAKTGALLVEMESLAIFEVCQSKKIPFGSIRAVSDTVQQTLPAAVTLIDTSGKLTARFWKTFLSRPQEWIDILRLFLSAKKANISLQKIFQSMSTG